MFTIERMQRIRRTILEKRRIEVTELSKLFGLSESTIRRDLDKLEKEGFLHKTYGGAVLADGYQPVAEDDQHASAGELENDKIARVAAEMAAEGDAIFLGNGPACLRLAGHLTAKQRLTVVTNDLEIALELAEAPYIHVKITGGDLAPGTTTLTGPDAISSLRGFCFNKAFFSPAGADLKFGYAAASQGEAHLLQAVMAVAQETVVLLNHNLFGRLALAPVAGLADLPVVVSSSHLPADFKAFYLAHQVKLFTAYEIAHPSPRRG